MTNQEFIDNENKRISGGEKMPCTCDGHVLGYITSLFEESGSVFARITFTEGGEFCFPIKEKVVRGKDKQ